MAHEHLSIHGTELAEIIMITYFSSTKAAEEITAHFRQQQAAHEAKNPARKLDRKQVEVLLGNFFGTWKEPIMFTTLDMFCNHIEHLLQPVPATTPTTTDNPLDLLADAKVLCQEILDALDGCPVKMTAKKLEHILAAAAGDLELAADLVNEQVFDALNK